MARSGSKDLRGQSYESVLAAFKKYDVNRDNKLSYKELGALMTDLNKGDWTQAKTDMLMQKIDRDNSGSADIQELMSYVFPRSDAMGGTAGASDYEQVLSAFRRFDTNRNGTLSKSEFTELMGQMKPGWTRKNTDDVFAAVDKDRSGEVESDELVAWLFGVPPERQKAAKKARRGGDRSSGALVAIEFVYGDRADVLVERIKNKLEQQMRGKIEVRKKVQGSSNTVSKVSARNGAVVFWDSAAMMAYRENPFASPHTADQWCAEMIDRHLPRLISGT